MDLLLLKQDLNTARRAYAAGGTYTAAITGGGYTDTTRLAVTELWNGSAWTEVADLNTARNDLGVGSGNASNALAFGGTTPPGTAQAITESWNGSSWTEVADLNTARRTWNGKWNNTSAIAAGGGNAPSTLFMQMSLGTDQRGQR